MKKLDDLIKELNELKIIQTTGDWAECLPDEIWNKHFKDNFKEVGNGVSIHYRRWYETSITVIEIFDRLLGIRHITKAYSESSTYEDCYVALKFMKMERFETISYRESEVEA